MAQTVEFEAEAPDGTTVRFRAPANTSDEELKRYALIEYQMRKFGRSQFIKEPAEAAPAAETAPPAPVPMMEPPSAPVQEEVPLGGLSPDMQALEERLNLAQKEQDIRMGQIGGGAAGLGLSLARMGADVGGAAMQGIGRNIMQGATRAGGGTGGEKWARNWAGQERPGVGGVPEAAAAYQRSKGQGKVSGRMSKMWGPAGPGEPAALVDRLLARSATPSGLDQVKTMFKSLMGPASLGARYALPPLALAAAGGEGIRAKQMYEEGDPTGATLAGLSALGAAGSLTPLAPVAVPLGAASGAMQYFRSRLGPDAPITPEEEARASRAAFGMYPRP